MSVLWESWQNAARRAAINTAKNMQPYADHMFQDEVVSIATEMRTRIAQAMTEGGSSDDEIINALEEFNRVFRPRAIALLETRPDWTAQ